MRFNEAVIHKMEWAKVDYLDVQSDLRINKKLESKVSLCFKNSGNVVFLKKWSILRIVE